MKWYGKLFNLQISCTIRATRKKRNIPIIVRVSDVNDNAPEFVNTPYETAVAEVRLFFQRTAAKDTESIWFECESIDRLHFFIVSRGKPVNGRVSDGRRLISIICVNAIVSQTLIRGGLRFSEHAEHCSYINISMLTNLLVRC